jgi:hypothetical protein
MINPYYDEVRKYYDGSLLETFLTKTNTSFNNAILQKKNHSTKWDELVLVYKKKGYARDVSNASHQQTNTLIIGFNGIKEGIIINISFLPKYIGLYFYHELIQTEIPIRDRFGKNNYHLSFYPFSLKHEDLAREIISLVNFYFPDFVLFNNLYASIEINNVVVDDSIKEVSTIFQVIFEDNMNIIF